jgi:peptide/nickel transport system substrate-binding protein
MFNARYASIICGIILAACAAPPPSAGNPEISAGSTQPAPPRTLNVGVRYELTSLSTKALNAGRSNMQKRFFNASMSFMDGAGAIHPYLAETLPQLNTDSWRVMPDGRMETTYRLKPNLTWHDGRALTADDFVFALKLYGRPGLGYFTTDPQDRIEDVLAPDPRTVIFRWNSLYPDAGSLRWDNFDPLPRHLLEPLVDMPDLELVRAHPYWTVGYVGAGPYQVAKWEPGAFLETTAFAGHALGRPRIDRLIVRFVPDDNTMLTNVLAGTVDVAIDNTLRYEHGVVLKREWAPTKAGTVILELIQPRAAHIQRRSDYVHPRALLDVRVRRALAHSVDKQAMIDGLFEGEQIPVADQLLPSSMPYFAEIDRVAVKYPYDLRRTDQLMADAGFRKAADGVYASAAERFSFTLISGGGSQNEKERAVLADSWRRAGIDVAEATFTPAMVTDPEGRATWPSVHTSAAQLGELGLARWTSAAIGTAGNRWRGENPTGWSDPEYDRLYDLFNATLDRSERDRQVVQMMRILTEDVASLFFFHNPTLIAHTAVVSGPQIGTPEHLPGWNVHEWQLR